VAEFLSALLGASGAALLGMAHALQQTMGAAASRPREVGQAAAVQQVLLALPAMGFAAGVMLGGAATLMCVRMFLGAEAVLGAVAFTTYSLLTAFAAVTVMRSVRTLFDHAQHQATAAARARGDAAEAKIAALQARMNPHFLFNALNTVAALVRTDPAAAEQCVGDLSEVLRRTLDRSAGTMGTVGEEVDYVRAYLEVEQQRWGDRLAVRWDVAPGIEDLPLPPLVLQPLVENALRHGLGGRTDGGLLVIRLYPDGPRIRIVVEDDGEGFPPRYDEGTGLGNLRQRLATIYGRAASVDISTGARARVALSIPIEPCES
jgi:two-component system sensor histidine kinase AlgZ